MRSILITNLLFIVSSIIVCTSSEHRTEGANDNAQPKQLFLGQAGECEPDGACFLVVGLLADASRQAGLLVPIQNEADTAANRVFENAVYFANPGELEYWLLFHRVAKHNIVCGDLAIEYLGNHYECLTAYPENRTHLNEVGTVPPHSFRMHPSPDCELWKRRIFIAVRVTPAEYSDAVLVRTHGMADGSTFGPQGSFRGVFTTIDALRQFVGELYGPEHCDENISIWSYATYYSEY